MSNHAVTCSSRTLTYSELKLHRLEGMTMNKIVDLVDVLSENGSKNVGTDVMARLIKYGIWKTVKFIHDQKSLSCKTKGVANPDKMLQDILLCLEDHLKPKRKDGNNKMKVEDFREFVLSFNENKDGKTNRAKLQKALNALGIPQSGLEAWYAIVCADKNSDGFIEEDFEWTKLIKHADKYWAIFNRRP